MKKLIFLFIIISSSHPIYAQSTVRDSLSQLLQKEKSDTSRVLLLVQLSSQYAFFKPDSAMLLALKGLELSRIIGFPKGEATSLNRIGGTYNLLGNYLKGMQLHLQALQIRERIQDVNGIAQSLNDIGNVLRIQGEYYKAIEYHLKAKKLSEQINNKEGLAGSINSLGRCYLQLKQYDSAIANARQAYEIANKFKDHPRTEFSLFLMGEIYLETGQKKLALEYYRRSIPYQKMTQNDLRLSQTFIGMAKLFENEGQHDSSVYYARQALIIAREKFAKQFLDVSSFLSSFYKNRRNVDSAFFYLEVAKAANDSLFSQEKTRQIQSLAFDEQLRQKDLEAERTRYQNQIRLYILLSALTVFLVIAIFLFRNNKQKQKLNAVLRQQKEKTEKAYEQLKATQAQLIQSEKMASLGELTAGIAHEIQNPLNFVNNFSEVSNELINEMVDEVNRGNTEEVKAIAKDVQQNLEKILRHGKQADGIVKGMLQHSRSSSAVKESTDINKLADEYLRLAFHGLRAKDKSFNAVLKTDYDETIGNINIIPQDIGRVILNLITNAFYAVTEKKKQNPDGYEPVVTVTTKRLGPPSGDGGKVEIKVCDNGNGISQKVLDKIFQPFFTTKPTGQGTGLGLSLSYDIIKAHGGELKVETKEGEGAEFAIELSQNK